MGIVIAWYLISPLFIDKVVDQKLVPSGEQLVINKGIFTNADSFHQVEGTATIVKRNNSSYLTLENFTSTNGPDLKVYLASDRSAKTYVNLGALQGNIGDQFYEIPASTELTAYPYVLIWCERFSVLFGSAELGA